MEIPNKTLSGFLATLLLLLSLNPHVEAAPVTPTLDVGNTIEAGLKVYKEIISNIKNGIESLLITEQLTNIAKLLADLNVEMQTKQREALSTILGINTKAVLAISSARTVVGRIKNICDTLLFVLKNTQLKDDKEKVKIAIDIFLKESKVIQPIIDRAVEKMSEVSAESVQIKSQFVIISSWANMKKEEMKTKIKDAVQKERVKAYASAAVCILIPPTCIKAYAVAAAISEGHKVKEVEKRFGKGLQGIESMKQEIIKIGQTTQELIKTVKTKKRELERIQGQLDQARMNGDNTKRYFSLFYQRFKDSVQTLYNQCVEYLKETQ